MILLSEKIFSGGRKEKVGESRMFMRLIASVLFAVGISLPALAVIYPESTANCDVNDLSVYTGNVTLDAIWYPNCEPGWYLPQNASACVKCLADSYCGGGVVMVEGPADKDYGIVACGAGLKSQPGSRTADDCGRVLRVGNDNLYLHKDRRTTPSLVVKIDGTTFYADITPTTSGEKTISSESTRSLHVSYGDQEYTIHSAIYE